MESTKLKTQQNALLASRGHKQSPATIQDLKWPGKYKARNCCCTSTSDSAPFPAPCHDVQGEQEEVLLFEHEIQFAF